MRRPIVKTSRGSARHSYAEKRLPMRKENFFVLIISLSLSVVACETILRFVNYPKPPGYGWSRPLSKGNFHSAEGAIRILLLGDSQVLARSTPADSIPGELLEKALNSETTQFSDNAINCGTLPRLRRKHQITPATLFDVDTLGAGGWGQDQELVHLRTVMQDQRYDLVLLWFTPENDIWNNAFPTEWPLNGLTLNGPGKPTFVLDKSGQLKLAREEDITSRLLNSDYKLYTLLLRAIYRLLTVTGHSNSVLAQRFFGWVVTADQYWYKNFISGYKTASPERVQDDLDLIRRHFNPLEFETIHPLALADPIQYEKSHFAIAANPSSAKIKYMVDLTKALIGEIKSTAIRSGSDFAAFWYDASKTLQPLYPKDGIYNISGTDLKISSAVMRNRLNEIFADTNHTSLLLEKKEWRKPGNDPHLTTEANEILMQSLARCLKTFG
jgi:hypothetical protein